MKALLELKGLSYSYGDQRAIRGIDLDVRRGEIFGLLGPNGAGKTTTLRCLAGLAEGQGELRLDGGPFSPARNPGHRARLGLVPQELAVYESMSARENLQFFGEMAGLAAPRLDDRVEACLALAGLEDRSEDRVATFSGGMKRRLNLAISELPEPELLMLDEPTAGVDPQSRSHLFDALENLRSDGRTLLYTTHYMEEAERLCDRIAIMDRGSVLALGAVDELAAGAGVPGASLEQVFLELTGRSLRDG